MLALSLCLVIASAIAARLSESERIALWRRTHTWPPNWQPESEGYKRLMEEREKEIMQIPDSAERWENWLQYVQGRYVKSFTPLGFQLVETPKHVHEKLAKEVNKGLENWDNLRSEGHIHVIHGPDSKFVDMMPTLREVHHDLLEMHEKWAGGIKLKPTSIYGVRLYENGSTLEMHLDKGYSHVISSIVHIAHEYDNDDEPWPLQIEGHDGKLYEVNLKPGQMVFYESAKALHGRMKPLKGKYYGSVFVHYQPVDKNVWGYTMDDFINAVPPHWNRGAYSIPNAPVPGASITTASRRCVNHPLTAPWLSNDEL